MNSPVDPALLKLVQQELKSLHDVLDNMSVEWVGEKTGVQNELGSISAALEEVKQRVQRLETGQKNLECYAELAQGRINDFQGMERHGGLIVSELNSGASGLGSSLGRGHCAEFMGKILYSHGDFLHPGV